MENFQVLGKITVWNDLLKKAVKGNSVIYFIFFRINIAVVLAPVLLVEATIRIITSTYLIVMGQIKNVLLAGFFM